MVQIIKVSSAFPNFLLQECNKSRVYFVLCCVTTFYDNWARVRCDPRVSWSFLARI
jgi:hypothetical protein